MQSLRLQPNEQAVFGAWFRELSQGEQRVAGLAAASFFKKSSLPQQQLKKIWDLCDTAHQGSVDSDAFCLAMRLIALAQSGFEPSHQACESYMGTFPMPHFVAESVMSHQAQGMHSGSRTPQSFASTPVMQPQTYTASSMGSQTYTAGNSLNMQIPSNAPSRSSSSGAVGSSAC